LVGSYSVMNSPMTAFPAAARPRDRGPGEPSRCRSSPGREPFSACHCYHRRHEYTRLRLYQRPCSCPVQVVHQSSLMPTIQTGSDPAVPGLSGLARSLGAPRTSYRARSALNVLCKRFFIKARARWVISIPFQRRLRRSATARAVPQPQKGSRTLSPSLLLALITLAKRASGFGVG
jgi:hypothetical protein